VLLVDGRMEGVWRHERKGGRLIVEVEPFAEQPGWVRRRVEEEAERLARFLGGELEFIWSNP
jgi:Winged helix DNA-binding domain